MSVKVHEAFSIDSFQDRLLWWDDFLGDQLQDEWREGGTGSAAVVDAQTGGIVRLTTGATTNDPYYMDWNNIRSLHITKKVTIEMRVKPNQNTMLDVRFGLRVDGTNYVLFTFNETVGGAINWSIVCTDGGASTSQDSGVATDTLYHIFRVECHTHDGTNHVHFYIDGDETDNSPIDTNVPDDVGDYSQPRFSITTREDVAKSVDIDYCVVRQEI